MANATEKNLSNMMPPPVHKPGQEPTLNASANVKQIDKKITGQSDEFVQPLAPRVDTTIVPAP